MRKALLLGGVASAIALTLAPQPASATNPWFACEPGFEIICTVADRVHGIVCNPRYLTC